jgi:copper(I)-binding protein
MACWEAALPFPAVILQKRVIAPSCLVLFFLAGIFLPACESGPPVITIEAPEAKTSPMLIGVASVFMEIRNAGTGGDSLIDASAGIPGTITELHDMEDGKMVKVDAIAIPSDSTVMLRPAAHHIMIFKIPRNFQEGHEFSLTLTFKKSGEKTVRLVLTQPGQAGIRIPK